jgi:hypothetical protein
MTLYEKETGNVQQMIQRAQRLPNLTVFSILYCHNGFTT